MRGHTPNLTTSTQRLQNYFYFSVKLLLSVFTCNNISHTFFLIILNIVSHIQHNVSSFDVFAHSSA